MTHCITSLLNLVENINNTDEFQNQQHQKNNADHFKYSGTSRHIINPVLQLAKFLIGQ